MGCLEEFFILNLMFMVYFNVQTSNENDNSKGQVSSIALISTSFVVFCCININIICCIILYHVWDHLSKSHMQQPITKVMNIFKKPPPYSSSNDIELLLIHPGSPDVKRRCFSMSVVSMEMERESILFDQDD